MTMAASDFLKLLAENNHYLVLDRGAPTKRHKRERVWIGPSDGRHYLEDVSPSGPTHRVELPRAILDDYLKASFIFADGPEDENGRTIYRLTQDGRTRGLAHHSEQV